MIAQVIRPCLQPRLVYPVGSKYSFSVSIELEQTAEAFTTLDPIGCGNGANSRRRKRRRRSALRVLIFSICQQRRGQTCAENKFSRGNTLPLGSACPWPVVALCAICPGQDLKAKSIQGSETLKRPSALQRRGSHLAIYGAFDASDTAHSQVVRPLML